jgi:NADPH:quinone reductase-like Zn-dependent oxidoreductase
MTAYQMLTRTAKVQKGERILVHGASGGVGTALVELGALMGLEVYGTCSSGKAEAVRKLGATTIDYKTEKFEKIIKQLPGGGGVDAVFDPLGGDHFMRSYSTLRKGGRFVGYGSAQASIMSTGIAFSRIKLSIFDGRGAAEFYKIHTMRKDHPEWFREDINHLCDLVSKDKLNPILAGVFPIEKVNDAVQQLESGKVTGVGILSVSK